MPIPFATNLLAPAAALVVWTLLILFWAVAKRLPALKAANLTKEQTVGGRGQDLDRILPPRVNWPAHNYAHLVEQPTLFYAVIFMLVLLGQGSERNLMLAWAYVAVRIVHSLWQIQVNTIPVRAGLFFIMTFILVALAISALTAALAV